MIIHGDNLKALKALMPRYAQKIDIIYIDPPYNTGNENWIYNDNVNSPMVRAWLKSNSPVDNEDLQRHDKWMCMMWPRLNMLKELLSDTGVLFVTIDDNEQPRLRLMLDEIFGEDNFVANLIWRKKPGGGQDSRYFAVEHDYILVYRKSDEFELNERVDIVDEADYKDIKNGRKCKLVPLEKMGSNEYREDRPHAYYSIKDPDGNDFYPMASDGREGCWRSKPENFSEDYIKWRRISNRKNVAPVRRGRWQPCEVKYFDEQPEFKKIKDRSIFYDVATTIHSAKELTAIFGRKKMFDTPKPVELIKRLIYYGGKDALVLDSFAGSGTTAHATLALNKEDGGNRNFILVECEDYADSITAERVRRVIHGVPASAVEHLQEGLGGSFTYCSLGDPYNVASILTGESLPSYTDMAVFVYHTATGKAVDSSSIDTSSDGLFLRDGDKVFWLFYRPDFEWLKSSESAFTEKDAERVAKSVEESGSGAVVFAAQKHLSQRQLSDMNIVFCQLPYLDLLGK